MTQQMSHTKINKEEKQAELEKYRDLVLATIDYYLDNNLANIKTADFDSVEHFNGLKVQVEEHFQKGRLTKLKQWFHNLTEMQVEIVDLKFNKYLQDKTNYDIDIFKAYFQRIEKIIARGKITSNSQLYDVNCFVDQLSQTEPVENQKIDILNKLLADYGQRKSRQQKKPIV